MNDYFNHDKNRVGPATRALDSQINHIGDEIALAFDRFPGENVLNEGRGNYGTDTGEVDAYEVELSQTVDLTDGFKFCFDAVSASTGASTVDVNGLGAKSIINPDGTATVAGSFPAGAKVCVMYDVGTDSFMLLSVNIDHNGIPITLSDSGTPLTTKLESVTFAGDRVSASIKNGVVSLNVEGLPPEPPPPPSGPIASLVEVSRIVSGDWASIPPGTGPTGPEIGNIRECHIDASGLRLYISNLSFIWQYALAAPRSLVGITYVGVSPILTDSANVRNFSMSTDGLHIITTTSTVLRHYTMSPAFDITSLTDTLETYDTVTLFLHNVYMKPDGTKWFTASHNTDLLYEYTMSTPYDPSSGTQTKTEDITDASANSPGLTRPPYNYTGSNADTWGLFFTDSEQYLHISAWYSGTPGDPPDMVYTFELTVPGDINGGKALTTPSPLLFEGIDGDSHESIDIDDYAVGGILITMQGWNEVLIAFAYSDAAPP